MSDTLRQIRYTPMRDVVRGRITGRLDLNRMIDRTALPQPCADCVIQVVKRTRLWRLEKIDVAQELIAHFHDGLDAGATAEQLVDHFGDVRRTAKLIRQAKRRNRPAAWHVMRCCGWSCVALIAVYLGLAVILFTGKPNIEVDYLAKLNARAAAVPEDERAWPLYRQALLELGYHPEDESLDRLIKDDLKPGEPRWDELAQLLRDRRAAIDQIRRAAGMSGLGFQDSFGVGDADRELFGDRGPSSSSPRRHDYTLLNVSHYHLHPLRSAGKLLAADAWLAMTHKDSDRATHNLTAILGIATHAAEVPTLIAGTNAGPMRALSLRTLSDLMQEHTEAFTESQLRDLAHRISDHQRQSLVRFEGERYQFKDILQHMYTKQGWMTDEGALKLAQFDDGVDVLFQSQRQLFSRPSHNWLANRVTN